MKQHATGPKAPPSKPPRVVALPPRCRGLKRDPSLRSLAGWRDRPLHLSPEHLRCAFRQRAAGSPVLALPVQEVEGLHALSGHGNNHDENADTAARRVWLLRGFEVEQVPRADATKGLLAPELLLNVLAQLSQRREATVPVLVGEVEERIGAREAPAFEVDEGEAFLLLVTGAPHGGHKRPRLLGSSKSTAAGNCYFSSLTLLMAPASGRGCSAAKSRRR